MGCRPDLCEKKKTILISLYCILTALYSTNSKKRTERSNTIDILKSKGVQHGTRRMSDLQASPTYQQPDAYGDHQPLHFKPFVERGTAIDKPRLC